MSGIYIHIPFCHAKCAYCDFFSTPRQQEPEAYVDALLREYDLRADEIPAPVNTVYIGGGTPSSLPEAQLKRLTDRFAALHPTEFTVEVNPEDVSPRLAHMLTQSGVNRVSMGIQTLDDAQLAAIGRRHTAAEAIDAVRHLHDAGIGNISLDIIYGLPGQTLDSWRHTLDGIVALSPKHISAYALSYEPGTRLWAMREAGKVKEADEALSEAMYRLLCLTLANAGYEHYEIANFAIPGYHSRHNSAYWDFTPYLGLGVAAHSFDGTQRRYNPPKIKEYISALQPITVIDPETADEQFNDFIMVALRTSRGLDLTRLAELFGRGAAERTARTAAPLIAQGALERTESGFRIAEASWLVADALTLPFIV